MDGIVKLVPVQLKLAAIFAPVVGVAIDLDGDFVLLNHQIPVVGAYFYIVLDREMRREGAR